MKNYIPLFIVMDNKGVVLQSQDIAEVKQFFIPKKKFSSIKVVIK